MVIDGAVVTTLPLVERNTFEDPEDSGPGPGAPVASVLQPQAPRSAAALSAQSSVLSAPTYASTMCWAL
jgi:hypothetical protein